MLKEDMAQPQSYSSGTSAPGAASRQLPGQAGVVGEEKRGLSDGPWGLPGLLSTNRLPDHGVRPACPSSKPHPSVPCPTKLPTQRKPMFPPALSTVEQVCPHLRDPLHSHTLTNTLAHTDSKTHIPCTLLTLYPPTYVLTHALTLTHTDRNTHTMPHWHGHTHSPIHTCPILSHACLHIPVHVPTKDCG